MRFSAILTNLGRDEPAAIAALIRTDNQICADLIRSYGLLYSQTVAKFGLNFCDIFVDIFNAVCTVSADTMVQYNGTVSNQN